MDLIVSTPKNYWAKLNTRNIGSAWATSAVMVPVLVPAQNSSIARSNATS